MTLYAQLTKECIYKTAHVRNGPLSLYVQLTKEFAREQKYIDRDCNKKFLQYLSEK